MNRFHEGFVLGDRYTLVTRIASGGTGDVCGVTDGVLARQEAVKILRPSMDEEEVFAGRFRNEALDTANLAHTTSRRLRLRRGGHLAYLVMELVPGEPFGARQACGPPPGRAGADIMGQAALALGAAHEAGVVHRDVSRPTSSSCPTAR